MIRYDIHKGVEKIKTKTFLAISGLGLVLGGGAMSLAILGSAHADSSNITFESPTYSVGNINGQNGWSKTGSYDVAVVNNTGYGYSTLGTQSLRTSNSVTSGSFGDQTFAPALSQQAGEAGAWDKTNTPVASPQPHFEAQFDLASTTKAQQTGMALSVSPDNGVGARMSYLRFVDLADGIHAYFDDVQGVNPGFQTSNFVETDVATLSYSTPHTIKFSMNFIDGPSNDVVKVYVDGTLVHTGTSWENYYRYDTESNPTNVDVSRTVDTLLFREGGAAVPGNAGNGYLVDSLNMLSSTIPTVAAPVITYPSNGATKTTAQMDKVDWTDVSGTAPVTYQYRSYFDAGYSNLAYATPGWLSVSEIPTPGTPPGDYYLQVRAQDGDGNTSPWSNDASSPYVVHVVATPLFPTSKADCKNDGWKTFTNPSFKNQGQCIAFVQAHAEGNLRMANPSQKIVFSVANTIKHGHDRDHGDRDDRDRNANTVEYWNYDQPDGNTFLHYKADVTCAFVDPQTNEARFMFQIPAGHPGLSGLYVVAYVKQIKHGADQYGHAATGDLATATQWCQTGNGFIPTMYAVTKGNVEVE